MDKVYHYCTNQEVYVLTGNILAAFAKEDWSSDAVLTKLIAVLTEENETFGKILSTSDSSENSRTLKELDSIADQAFVCTKQFLWANTFDLDENKAEDATRLWKDVFDKYDLQLHRRSYENQMGLSQNLIDHLKDADLRAIMDGLTGVSPRFDLFVTSSNNFRNKYQEIAEQEAAMEEMASPSTQRSVVRKIINDQLLTYMGGVVMAMPEKYDEIARVLEDYIQTTNTKARTRKTLSENQEEPEVEAQ